MNDLPRAAGPAASAAKFREVSDWLIRDGRFMRGNRALFAGLCERVAAAGVPLHRGALHLRALHPDYRGVSRVWVPGQPIVESFLDHGLEKTALYIESPVREVAEGGRQLEWRLDSGEALPFAILEELREKGFVQYVIAPLTYAANGIINALSWATREPGGFSSDDLALLQEVLPAFAAVVEAKALWRFAKNMLTTYVGREPARLILEGQVRRGDVRTITAALMLVDLRDFTLLSDRANPRAVIRMLNEYFDSVFPAIHGQGGDVMEIMGDGVLAIFHQEAGDDAGSVCRAALAVAGEVLQAIAERNQRRPPDDAKLHAGVALHYGTVSYGNIGSGERLDFTVIGPDVNMTSRIERLCRELDRNLIMSEAFAGRLDRPVWELGHFELRGFSRMQRLYTLTPE